MKTIKCISSMATRQVLKKMAEKFQSESGSGQSVALESVGGVDAVKRLEASEKFDLAVLTADAFPGLVSKGIVAGGSIKAVALSEMVIAVSDQGASPKLDTREALVAAMKSAKAIGYSSGPSGKALMRILEQWGVLEELKSRLVQAVPGVPVGNLIAEGKVDIGFQQRSELIHSKGVVIVGAMPAGYEVDTVFSAAVCTSADDAELAAAFIEFITGSAADAVIREEGMTPQ